MRCGGRSHAVMVRAGDRAELRDNCMTGPWPGHPVTKWLNQHTGPRQTRPDTLCEVTLIKPLFLVTGIPKPFLFFL